MKKREFKRKKKSKLQVTKDKFLKIKKIIFDDSDDNDDTNLFTIAEVIVIIIISILFGGVLGYIITYSKLPSSKTGSNAQEIINTYNSILDNYYGDVDKDKLLDAAVKGMIESLDDPYSNYMDKDTTSDFNESVDGTFVGIGVVVFHDDGNKRVLEIIKNSPAEKSGILVDDLIIKVDGLDVADMDPDEFVELVKGDKNTKVTLTILRNGEEKDFVLTRKDIEVQNVSSKVLDYENNKIGYMKIESFAKNSYKQFKSNLDDLESNGINSLIIDLRSNPGGHLYQTRQMLSLFFDKKTVLYQLQSKNSKKKKIYSSSNITRNYPVVILINSSSASASEIFASCFKDNYKNVTIIGVNSYGKGTVQKSESLSDGTSIKYTTQKWLTSKGKWLNNKGLKPDIEVELSDEYYENPVEDLDNQLQEAIKKLKESN